MAYEIATLPKLVGNEPNPDARQDPVRFQAAIDTANILRDYEPLSLFELADKATEFLCDEVPTVAKMVIDLAEAIHKEELNDLEKRRVWAGAGIMRSFHIMEQLNKAA